MKEIKLTNSIKVALVDDEDYERLIQYNWRYSECKDKKSGYATSTINGKSTQMHRFILNLEPITYYYDNPNFVDHKDRNKLNNQRKNLRLCTMSQNLGNQPPRKNCHSDYKGVRKEVSQKKGLKGIQIGWAAWIQCFGRGIGQTKIGIYDTEVDAAKAYDEKAKELFGEFAWLNFNNETSR